MKEIYFDHGATTRPLETVVEKMMAVMLEDYGNPSSYHKMGMKAENHIKKASDYFANVFQCSSDEIIYTSGGTESNNMAIIGTALAYQRIGKRIITTQIEHPSVKEPFRHLENQGFEVIYLPVDREGYINIDQLTDAINDETTLVSIMHVNNETGTIQDIEKIGARIKQKNPNTHFHTDAIQSFGKVPIYRQKSFIDLLSVSSHKIYGPKGVGLLYKNKNVRMHPQILGGGQQKGYRAGTQDVPGIVGMHVAAEDVITHLKQYGAHVESIKEKLTNMIIDTIEDVYVSGPNVTLGAPHIVNIGFKDIRSEVLLHALEAENIYVSSGSACSSNKKQGTSSTLEAIGKDEAERDGAIRFSFGIHNTPEQVEETVLVLQKTIPMLRKVLRLGGNKR